MFSCASNIQLPHASVGVKKQLYHNSKVVLVKFDVMATFKVCNVTISNYSVQNT
jgi:hypothetical protein